MEKDVVFRVTMVTKGKLFTGCDCVESEMDVFLIFLFLYRMATGTIHINKSLPEVKERIGIYVAIHTGKLA